MIIGSDAIVVELVQEVSTPSGKSCGVIDADVETGSKSNALFEIPSLLGSSKASVCDIRAVSVKNCRGTSLALSDPVVNCSLGQKVLFGKL